MNTAKNFGLGAGCFLLWAASVYKAPEPQRLDEKSIEGYRLVVKWNVARFIAPGKHGTMKASCKISGSEISAGWHVEKNGIYKWYIAYSWKLNDMKPTDPCADVSEKALSYILWKEPVDTPKKYSS